VAGAGVGTKGVVRQRHVAISQGLLNLVQRLRSQLREAREFTSAMSGKLLYGAYTMLKEKMMNSATKGEIKDI